MFRAMTYQERQDHPRRCQARRHDGQPCGRFAIVGGTVCTTHGGGAPQVRRKAMLRRYFELDQKAQVQAAINVFLPPELHPLVSGGGRGHRKAAKAAPEPATMPAFDGIAAVPRNRPRTATPLVIDVGPPDPRDPPVGPPNRADDEMRDPYAGDPGGSDMASRSGPPSEQLMTLGDAAEANWQAVRPSRIRRAGYR